MVRSLERRVARLEESVGGGDRCPECGSGPDDERTYEVVFVDPGEAPHDEYCGTCGCALSLSITLHW
jgi:hypothetical protein